MKKLIPILLTVLLFASCQQDPKLSDLDNDFVVYTNYDKNAEFNNFTQVYVPDSVLLIANSSSKDPVYWKSENATPILNDFIEHLTARGYEITNDKEMADLGLQVTYVESTSYFVGSTNPYWWWDYPGYWNPGYWYPGWSGYDWYYPYYQPVYSYNVGSLLAEIVNLEAVSEETKKVPVIWNAYMSGLLSDSNKFNLQLSLNAVNQAFDQSPYITTKAK